MGIPAPRNSDYICWQILVQCVADFHTPLALAFFPLEGQDMKLRKNKETARMGMDSFSFKTFIDVKLKGL